MLIPLILAPGHGDNALNFFTYILVGSIFAFTFGKTESLSIVFIVGAWIFSY